MTVSTQPAGERHESAGVRASLLEYLHACPTCRNTALRHYCRVPSLFNEGEFIHYERCTKCGLVLRNPRLPASYRLERYEVGVLQPERTELNPRSQIHCAHMIRVIRRVCRREASARLLDFGCGNGGFLLEARAAGFTVMGLELNRALARHVSDSYGIPVFQGLLTDPAFAHERFHVITAFQVFEHLLDPRDTLSHLRRHLVPPGLVLIEVPNLRSIRERARRGTTMDDSHLFYFSAKSLGHLLAGAGFRILEVHEGMRPYRFMGDYSRLTPLCFLRWTERLLSILQIKTGLGVLACTT